MPKLFDDCTIALSGTFEGHKQAQIIKCIKDNGGNYSAKVEPTTTHLIPSQNDFDKQSTKYKQAITNPKIKIFKIDWIVDSLVGKKKLPLRPYIYPASSSPTATQPSTPPPEVKASLKTDQDSEDQGKATKLSSKREMSRGKKRARAESEKPDGSRAESDEPPNKKSHIAKKEASPPASVVSLKAGPYKPQNIQVDDFCPLNGSHKVYIDPTGRIYDASLNQTDVKNNHNKFYRIQLLESVSASDFRTWTRWGRVGENGASSLLGNGDIDSAISNFNKKFKDKSGLTWESRNDAPKAKKYTFIERSYDEDDDESDESKNGSTRAKSEKGNSANGSKRTDSNASSTMEFEVKSQLHEAVQDVLKLILNKSIFADTLADMSYDANKLPLGKLSKKTLNDGFIALKNLAEVISDSAKAEVEYGQSHDAVIEMLTNRYYTVIPHSFGRNRPPHIGTDIRLKREIELLENLLDMTLVNEIMDIKTKIGDQGLHPIDQQFAKLNLKEMTPLNKKTSEFQEIENYLMKSHGHTHQIKFNLQDIFRIERQGEHDRFIKSEFSKIENSDRRLLWHGSRCTNFGGILLQGLRIAPSSAPVSGYMFGHGVYFGDTSSKSANYCWSNISGGIGLLLLCEAELGSPMLELQDANYNAGEEAKKSGRIATWGQGLTGPKKWKDAACISENLKGVKIPDFSLPFGPTGYPNAYLQYNEYIVYSEEQIKIRYLLKVKMDH
ncbi:MAG: hypothetical protein M1829_001802 [Trizodia sp. TS-e1964]|nr:MAG: hypothetical protein M1829_001802 [Trizodia sp. TS-e1964]